MKGKKTLQQKGVSRTISLLAAKRKQSIRPFKREVTHRATPMSGGAKGTEESKPLYTPRTDRRKQSADIASAHFCPLHPYRPGWEYPQWLGDVAWESLLWPSR